MNSKNVAEIIVEQLVMWGVKRVYGVIGDANMYLVDALYKNGNIKFIQTRHETAAAFMASAEAKITGSVGVCTATSGPGLVNMLNGMGDAYNDKVPLFAITGQVPSNKLGMPVKQYLDQQVMVQPLALWSSQLTTPQTAAELTWLGLHYAASRGGVTHLSVLKDLWPQIGGKEIKVQPPLQKAGPPIEPTIQDLARKLENSMRPVIMVGRGIAGLVEEVKSLAEKLNAPIVTTLPAKGLIPEDFYLSLGGLGQAGTEIAGDMLIKSDLILILGAMWWPMDYVPEQKIKIIQIDSSNSNLALKHPAFETVNGVLKDIIPVLSNRITARNNEEMLEEVRAGRKRWFANIEQERQNESSPIMPQALMAQLEKVVSSEALIVLDVGDHVIWFTRCYWGSNENILISGSWRSMGFGLPAAIAAQLINPERPVVCISGDGGLTMALSEMITASQHHTPIKMIVVNNGSLAMEENRAIVTGLLTEGTKLLNPNFVKVAEACDWEGTQVKEHKYLATALKVCMENKKPYLLDVVCAKPMPPHTKL